MALIDIVQNSFQKTYINFFDPHTKKKFSVIPHISSKSSLLKACVGGIKFGLLSKFIGALLMFK